MKNTILSFVLICSSCLSAVAVEAPKEPTAKLDVLLVATEEDDLERFESICGEKMKAAMTEKLLNGVSKQVAPLMKEGYKKVYMGALNRGRFITYYWKLDFDGENVADKLAELSIAELSIADGKVVGFFIR
ncbi:MAG: hypothetical protein ACSHX6_08275 [Akkermansiaceae bacterium]